MEAMEKEFRLSFYKEVAEINRKHDVFLVQHVESGDFFVKKTVSAGCLPLYRILQEEAFPHIPRVIELIDGDQDLIVIEEYIHGKNLDQLMNAKKSFTPEDVCAVTRSLCRILQPLHNHSPKIIHRDIKPSNLILDSSGGLYLIDFDASKKYDPAKNRDTVLMGTAEFAAPEQYGFGQSDERTDIYSIGALMNMLLTGKVPSQEKYRGPLTDIIAKCTAIDPRNRYQNCAALSDALTRFSPKTAAPASEETEEPAKPPLPSEKKKKPWQHILSGILAVFFTAIAFNSTVTDADNQPLTGYILRVNQIGIACVFFLLILYFGNYFNFRNRFPWKYRHKNVPEALRLFAGFMLCVMIPVFFTVLLELL